MFVGSPGRAAFSLAALVLVLAGAPALAQESGDLRLETEGEVEERPVLPRRPPFAEIKVLDEEPAPRPRRRRTVTDPYAATGLDLGGFRLFPTLEIGAIASSNPGRSASNAEADIGLRLRPSLRLESEWVRHQLTANVSGELQHFLSHEELGTKTANATLNYRHDIHSTTRADFDYNYSLTSTGTESSEVPDTAKGSRVDHSFGAFAALTHDFGPMEARLRLGSQHNYFGDVELVGGGVENNADRNYSEPQISLRGTLKGAKISPFAEAAYEPRFHHQAVDRNGVKRNSHGLRLTAGVALNDDPIWAGEIGASLLYRTYADDTLEDVIVPGLSAAVTWRPTDLTRFEFNAGLSLTETVAAGSSATANWTAGLKGTYALRENIDLIAGLNVSVEDASSGVNFTSSARAGLEWDLNPMLSWNAFYEGTWFNGAAANSDYADHRLLTSIILKR